MDDRDDLLQDELFTAQYGPHRIRMLISLRDAERFRRACALQGVPTSVILRTLAKRWTDVVLGDADEAR